MLTWPVIHTATAGIDRDGRLREADQIRYSLANKERKPCSRFDLKHSGSSTGSYRHPNLRGVAKT
ncbi:hypothetical protein SAMN05444169_6337 [Bradyrhizobium erythrophlei]|uniref:Uncharacterized protein n=1 Tax=Bradyrhizobium erythrophlei TaxID=1437360 RepID=A0A1M5R544_9BRAD|nr:hypothetical protein SAMN05444169_6337 [Bradyrhizobium erythrophlei]